MGFFSDSLNRIGLSATMGISVKARALAAEGRDIIILSQGEPDFDTPENIKQAAIRAMAEGKTKYTDIDGIPELKDAIVRQVQARERPHLQALADLGRDRRQAGAVQRPRGHAQPGRRGDHAGALLGQLCRHRAVRRAASPVFAPCRMEDGFKLKPEALETAITPKTKWLMFNSPSNPTGAAYTKAELKALDRRAAAPPACLGDDRRHVRAPDLRRLRVLHAWPRSSRRSTTAR